MHVAIYSQHYANLKLDKIKPEEIQTVRNLKERQNNFRTSQKPTVHWGMQS